MKPYLSGKEPRCTECFDFDWYFYHGEKEVEPGECDVSLFRKVQLPHDWSLDYPFSQRAPSCGSGGYVETGIGWYRKIFRISEDALQSGEDISGDGNRGGKIFLRFDGAYMLVNVWLNGIWLGRHVYGYTPFEWEITGILNRPGQDNVLDVRVDNSAQPNSRWYSGSGITRDVWVYRVQSNHIMPYGVWVQQPVVSEEKAKLRIETRISLQPHVEDARVETTVFPPRDDSSVAGSHSVKLSEAAVCQELEIEAPMLWSPETPNLYTVATKLYLGDVLVDEVYTRTGIRSAAFHKEKGFLLNGRPYKINGVCLHHDGGCAGAAVPIEVWERRLGKLKEMGANAVRMAHNPPDAALLHLCDKEGFLVMDEAFDEWSILKGKEFGSNTHESRGYSEWFDECHEEDLRAMLLRDRNHPSIVIWSIGNEVPEQQSENGAQIARHLIDICREYDKERAITQANDQICSEPYPAKEDFLQELDVVGYNYVGRWRMRAETFYDEDKRAYPDWCMIGTENNGTGGVRGEYPLQTPEEAGWWKLPYYSVPVGIGKLLRYTMSHDYVAGDFMWTGVDYLGEAHWPERSSSAGALDTCGFEKDGFYLYQSIWKREKPMVHLFPHWNLDIEEGTIIPVLCYTSCDSVELLLNGKSYGRKAYAYPAYGMTKEYGHFDKPLLFANTGDLFLSWDVPYEPGHIEAIGYCNGKEAARHSIRTANAPARLHTSCYQDRLAADGRSVAQIEVTVYDADGNFCPQADSEITFTVEGRGRLIGVDNGNSASHESMRAGHIHAFHGKALALIRSDGEKGECLIKITSPGLMESIVKIVFDSREQ